MKKVTAFICALFLLTACGDSGTADMSDYDLLVSVFGKHRVDLHDDLGVELLEGETWVMSSTNAHIISTEQQARELAEDIYAGGFAFLSLDFLGENDSFFVFRLSNESVLHRVMIQKDWQENTEREHLYRYRDDVIQQLEQIIEANVSERNRAATLRRLTAFADEMNSVWGIWDGWDG